MTEPVVSITEEFKAMRKRLEGRRKEILAELEEINSMLGEQGAPVKTGRKGRKRGPMSEETKAKLRKAQQARWDKVKKKGKKASE